MNTAEQFHGGMCNEADLLQLEIEIARRADELAMSRGTARDHAADWDCWLEAEREVLHAVHEAVFA